MRSPRSVSARVVLVCALAVGCAPSGTPVTPTAPQTPTTGEAIAGDECPGGAQWDGERCVPVIVATPPAPTPVPAATQASAPAADPTGRGPAMVRIPAGPFWMGSNDGEDDEKPVHQVTVSAFEMDVTEVTVAQYRTCVTGGGCPPPDVLYSDCNYGKSGKDDHPMDCVDWTEAGRFCAWAGKRLPTEAEWEYAARGSDSRTYPWGNATPKSQLCWKRLRSGTCQVASFPAGDSPFGLHDMAGNVWEWTSTQYCDSYSPGASCQAVRVIRGGSLQFVDARFVRAAIRSGFAPTGRGRSIGFRCARP